MNKKILLISILLLVVLVAGCTKPINEVKNDKYLEKQVTIKGTTQGSIKLGSLSGYSLKDDSGDIFVSSFELPKNGEKQTVKGTIKKIPLIDIYYLETK